MPFKIPLIGPSLSLDALAKDYVGQVSNYAVTDVNAKVNEAAASVMRTSGGFGSFLKMGANGKSIAEVQAEAAMARGVISPNSLPQLPIDRSALSDLSSLGSGPEAQVSAAHMRAEVVTGYRSTLHKVSLQEVGGYGKNEPVFFDVLPEITEQHTIDYEAVAPPQFPGAFQKYKGNQSTQWQLNITFISRTADEATKNYEYLLKLRGWTKPFYGGRTGEAFPGKLGAPPPVLKLRGLRDLIGPVPVVITSLNWTWPKDVDYIATKVLGPDKKPIPFPVVMNIPIQLVESYSIVQFNSFSLADYRRGDLDAAFLAPDLEEPEASTSTNTTAAPGPDTSDVKGAAVSAAPVLPSSSKPEPTATVSASAQRQAQVKALQDQQAKLEREMQEINQQILDFFAMNNSNDTERLAAVQFKLLGDAKIEAKKRQVAELNQQIARLGKP